MSEKDQLSSREEGAVGGVVKEDGATSTRARNDSECSTEGADQGKRLRIARDFMVPSIAASPPKFVSLEEIMSATDGINNMALAHEIAVDKDFRLEKLEPPDNSIHKVVKETIHRAFWDNLTMELAEDPPNYSHAIHLLQEIKELLFTILLTDEGLSSSYDLLPTQFQNLFKLLLPQHSKIKEDISEQLDVEFIRQKAERGVLDFPYYAQYVIGLMSRMCCPARDSKIRELMQMTEIVPIFRGILQTLELMMLDWANFHIELIRPQLAIKSVEYEKKKFTDFLQVVPDGLESTRQWLLRHYNADDKQTASSPNIQSLASQVVAESYLELLEWDSNNPYPETLVMDEKRFSDLSEQYRWLSVSGAILLLTASTVPALQGVTSFKDSLKNHINTLLHDSQPKKPLEEVLQNVAVQVVKDVNESLVQHGHSQLDEDTSRLLQGQIVGVSKTDHKIRTLIRLRAREFLLEAITSTTAAPLRVPPGLSSLKEELTKLTSNFLRLVSHNRLVYGGFYHDIVNSAANRPTAPEPASQR